MMIPPHWIVLKKFGRSVNDDFFKHAPWDRIQEFRHSGNRMVRFSQVKLIESILKKFGNHFGLTFLEIWRGNDRNS